MTNEEILKQQKIVKYEKYFIDAMSAARTDEREQMVKDGWRQCAHGQKETQFCAQLEAYKAEILKEARLPDGYEIVKMSNEATQYNDRHSYEGGLLAMREKAAAAIAAERERSERFAEWLFDRGWKGYGAEPTASLRAIFEKEEGGDG